MTLLDFLFSNMIAYYVILGLAFIGFICIICIICRIVLAITAPKREARPDKIDVIQNKRIKELEAQVEKMKQIETDLADIKKNIGTTVS